MLKKKTYQKPIVASREIVCGVFGNYNDIPGGGGDSGPHPFKPVTDRNLHQA